MISWHRPIDNNLLVMIALFCPFSLYVYIRHNYSCIYIIIIRVYTSSLNMYIHHRHMRTYIIIRAYSSLNIYIHHQYLCIYIVIIRVYASLYLYMHHHYVYIHHHYIHIYIIIICVYIIIIYVLGLIFNVCVVFWHFGRGVANAFSACSVPAFSSYFFLHISQKMW